MTSARTAADPAARQRAAQLVQSFGLDLFHALASTDDTAGNLVCSPYSVAVALAMTRNGARGATADEMDRVLHAPALQELNAGLDALSQHIDSLAVDSANSLWGQRGFRWEPGFLDALSGSYGAGVRQTDYVEDPESARSAINGWTSDRTHGRIPELLPRGILDQDTRLVLVNAIHLKARWAVPFISGATQNAPFTRADGSTVQAPMMLFDDHSRLPYARGPGWQAVDLRYGDGGLAMAVVVPDAGRMDEVLDGLAADVWRGLLSALRPTAVALRLPRWTSRTQLRLDPTLSDLGMPTAFTGGADLSGMTQDDRLWIKAVAHEAFVAVDEWGTEAAAATGVVAMAISAVMNSVQLTVDRPFLFVLHDTATGTPLFIGRVSDPT